MKLFTENIDKKSINNVELGENVKIYDFTNLYGCKIGDNTKVGAFVEIQKGVKIGKNCKISSHTFICEGVDINDNCFIGHGVMFINDRYPRSVSKSGELEIESDWKNRFCKTEIGENVSIGSNSTIIGGIKINDGAVIGAGSVLLNDVPAGETWAGSPARKIR